DFDGYAVPGWAWSDVIDHFRAIETDLDFAGVAHGDAGPIPVRRAREIVGSTQSFVAAAQQAGFDWIPDLNDVAGTSALPAGDRAPSLNHITGVSTLPPSAYTVS